MWQLVTNIVSSPLVRTLATSMGIQWAGWAVACFFHTEKFYDLTGSLTFILLSHMSHNMSKMTTWVYWQCCICSTYFSAAGKMFTTG